VPTYRRDLSDLRVAVAEATVQTGSGKSYEFEDERWDLPPVIFLEPLGNVSLGRPQNQPL